MKNRIIPMSCFMGHNGHIYEMLGLRASSLSAATKAGAGQKGSNKHLSPNILYMMLCLVIYWSISISSIFNPVSSVKNKNILSSFIFGVLKLSFVRHA